MNFRHEQAAILILALGVTSCSTGHPREARAEDHVPEYALLKDDHGNHLGCSWYCGSPPIRVSASSTLRDGIFSYAPANAHDSKKDTVWVEGAAGQGIGERLVFNFDLTDKESYPEELVDEDWELGIDYVSIINGFARSEALWNANSRVKTLKLIFRGKDRGSIELKDTMEPQGIELPRMEFVHGQTNELAFEITEVYPGTKHEDTALADFFFSGFGVH